MAECLIALGSNQADPTGQLAAAVRQLQASSDWQLRAVSGQFESHPVGGPAGQSAFLNAAAVLETSLTPGNLLERLQAIEAHAGRIRGNRWDPRTLDLDLLLYDQQDSSHQQLVSRKPSLWIPHPRMTFRPFVMTPAMEIASDWRHPELAATLSEIDAVRTTGADAIRVAGAGHRRLAAELAGLISASPLPVIDRDSETWLELGPAGTRDRPKLQVLTDTDALPMPTVPTLWLEAAPVGEVQAELTAAVACVWPGLPASGLG